jgi:Fe-S-cluster containining protein
MAARRVLDKPPDYLSEQHDAENGDYVTPLSSSASDWYESFRLACPFLYEDACTIYEQRPMACREHYVVGSACGLDQHTGGTEPIKMPVSMSEVLGRLASDLEGTDVEALVLPLALFWADENAERGRRTWPTVMMVERLTDIVRMELARSTVAVTCSA